MGRMRRMSTNLIRDYPLNPPHPRSPSFLGAGGSFFSGSEGRYPTVGWNSPLLLSAPSSFFRQRARVGPMLPSVVPSAAATSE